MNKNQPGKENVPTSILLDDDDGKPIDANADTTLDLKDAAMKAGLPVKATEDLRAKKIGPAAAPRRKELPLELIKGNARRKVEKWFYIEGKKPDPRYSEKTYNDMTAYATGMIAQYLQKEVSLHDLGSAMISEARKGGMFPDRSKERYQEFAASIRNIAELIKAEIDKEKNKTAIGQ